MTSYGHDNGQELQPAGVRSLIPTGHLEFIKGCRDYYETTGHILHANYKPERQLRAVERGDAVGFSALCPATALLRQGRHRGPHGAEERRDFGPGLPQVHRHLLSWRGLAHGALCRQREGLASEHGGPDGPGVESPQHLPTFFRIVSPISPQKSCGEGQNGRETRGHQGIGRLTQNLVGW